MNDSISRQAAIDALNDISSGLHARKRFDEEYIASWCAETIEQLPPAQPEQQHGRIFQEIVVEYLSSTYPEYEGKPYFSIKYTENGQEFIGYGTYKPEVLSEYLKEYFLPSAQPEVRTQMSSADCIRRQTAIDAINSHFGFNIEEEYGSAVQEVINSLPSVQAKRKVEKWNKLSNDTFHCRECGKTFIVIQGQDYMNFCPNCEADMRGEQDE